MIILTSHLKGCDLQDIFGEKSSLDMSKIVQEKKEEKAFAVLQKTIYQQIWKQIRESISPSPRHAWKILDVVASNHENELLPIEYWKIYFEEYEFIEEDYKDLKENSLDFDKGNYCSKC